MPTNGSYTFFDTITVSWSYDSSKQQLTVSGTLNGKPMSGPVVLSPGNKTGQLVGQDGATQALVDLDANFVSSVLAMSARQTNPSRTGQHDGNF